MRFEISAALLFLGHAPKKGAQRKNFYFHLLNLIFCVKKDLNPLDLPKDFFKQFKGKDQFNDFFASFFKQGVEAMLQAELDEHLGYDKHSVDGYQSGNSRNGFSKKTVKTDTVGDMVLAIPRD